MANGVAVGRKEERQKLVMIVRDTLKDKDAGELEIVKTSVQWIRRNPSILLGFKKILYKRR